MLNYSDSEVDRYHPICEDALNQALRNIGLDSIYQVDHHKPTYSLEMDFVIENQTSNNYLCVIEVKKTPAAVNSIRYQFQAESYVQSNSGKTEKPYYIITNLECAYAFRYDASRPKPYQQMLEPGLEKITDFKVDDEQVITNKLAVYFERKILDFIADRYAYQLNLVDFAIHMEPLMNDSVKWKTHLAVLLYEYIRGSFNYHHRTDLKDIRLFGSNVQQICSEAGRINFKGIFDYTTTTHLNRLSVPNSELNELYVLGNQNVLGDSVADVLHSMVTKGNAQDGEVATDVELARLVATLARLEIGTIKSTDIVCDPAAGSGNLICSAIEVMGLFPQQIWANDINPRFIELLSLRLGLNYAGIINHRNSPQVTNSDITNLSRDDFSDVKIVLMNPPYVKGIDCIHRKQSFFNTIQKISGSNAITESGQMPLEAVFLELMTELVTPGTVISCVFPTNFLTARGREACIIREFMLSKFGLKSIFMYPIDGTFENVTKSTCILVGRAKTPSKDVNVISSYTRVPDLDIHEIEKVVKKTFMPPGFNADAIPVTKLLLCAKEGWRFLRPETKDAIKFVNDNFSNSANYTLIEDLSIPMKRGTAGNKGKVTDLLFLCDNLINKYSGSGLCLAPAMRNSKYSSFIVGTGDSGFFDENVNSPVLVNNIINDYIPIAAAKIKRQNRGSTRVNTLGFYKSIVSNESRKAFPPNSVLIPRGIRKEGSVYLTDTRTFVSTNFLVCSFSNAQDALLASTWMTTLFYQLMCEISSKNEAGLRKMEVKDIKKTYMPVLSKVSANTISKLSNIARCMKFVNLYDSQIRDVDKIWAEELFGTNATVMLDKAQVLLSYLVNIRDPQL